MRNFFAALCLLSSLSFSVQAFSQPVSSPSGSLFPAVSYPRDYFRDPLAVPMSLAANFGELRPNHYHMGLDIRTQHRENLPVYAAGDGYIARVEIEPAGFGQAIYIRHPNGYTTVYGHLNQFFPALAEYVSQQQYKQQSWQVDLDIPSSMFPVKKGEFIAYSGNTGGSQGPHLHFEIRRTAGDVNQNPLLFGLPVPDNVPPVIARLAWYDRNLGIYEQAPHILQVRRGAAARGGSLPAPKRPMPVRGSKLPAPKRPMPVREGKLPAPKSVPAARGGETAAPSTLSKTEDGRATVAWTIFPSLLTVGTSRISFSISASDAQSGSANPNGIYEAELFEDDEPVIGFRMNNISYDDTRNLNAHIDYRTRAKGGPFLQHLSLLPGYPSPTIYASPAGRPSSGVIDLSDGREHAIRIEVSDTYGNTSSLSYSVRYQRGAAAGESAVGMGAGSAAGADSLWVAGKRFYAGMVDGVEADEAAFFLGEKSLYDSVVLGIRRSYSSTLIHSPTRPMSDQYAIGAPWVPLLQPVLVRLKAGRAFPVDSLARSGWSSPTSRVVMVRTNGSQKEVQRVEWNDGWASARFREFGDFQLVEDNVAPVITPLQRLEGTDLGKAARIAFSVKDDLGAVRRWRAELDGAWLCFTNDKGLAYIYKFDQHCLPGPHTLRVSVEDMAGNKTAEEYHFTR